MYHAAVDRGIIPMRGGVMSTRTLDSLVSPLGFSDWEKYMDHCTEYEPDLPEEERREAFRVDLLERLQDHARDS